MDFLGVAFLHSLASFGIAFLENCCIGESLWTATVLKLWLRVSKGMLPVKCCCYDKPLFVSVEFHGDHNTVTKLMCIWPPSLFEEIIQFRTIASVSKLTFELVKMPLLVYAALF